MTQVDDKNSESDRNEGRTLGHHGDADELTGAGENEHAHPQGLKRCETGLLCQNTAGDAKGQIADGDGNKLLQDTSVDCYR